MSKKIEWFQEVLSLEPGSRVFFPLAKLYVEIGEIGNAAIALSRGLDRHPEHLEARMLHIQVLSRLDKTDQALEEVQKVVGTLKNYPAFWRLWAQGQPEDNRDFSVFLMLVAAGMQGEIVRWTDVMLEGVNNLSDRLVGPLPDPLVQAELSNEEPAPRFEPKTTFVPEFDPEDSEEPEEFEDTDAEQGGKAPSTLRTRTMADVLAAQGDFSGAMGIYRELWSRSGGTEKNELQDRIEKMEAGMGDEQPSAEVEKEDAFSQHAKNRLISTLETLAARFEARVRNA